MGPASGSAATSAADTPSSTLRRETTVSSRRSAASSAHGATAARRAGRSAIGSTVTPASLRISRPSAWKVRTRTAPGATPSGATAASRRSVISSAARLLKVIARIASGGVPVAISQAARATSVVVFPDANTDEGPYRSPGYRRSTRSSSSAVIGRPVSRRCFASAPAMNSARARSLRRRRLFGSPDRVSASKAPQDLSDVGCRHVHDHV